MYVVQYSVTTEAMAIGEVVIDGKKVADPDCPSPCIYDTYTYTISQSEYPSVSVQKELVKNVNQDRKPTNNGEEWTIQNIR